MTGLMFPFRSTFFRSIGQVFSLLLILAVGMQGLPVHTVVQHLQDTHTHHECSHAKGYCPMNPDGPCRCDHNPSEAPDKPTFRSCGNNTSSAVLRAASPKWRLPSSEKIPAPHAAPVVYLSSSATRSSQRTGDDVFHPPRTQAATRPGSTLQALHSA